MERRLPVAFAAFLVVLGVAAAPAVADPPVTFERADGSAVAGASEVEPVGDLGSGPELSLSITSSNAFGQGSATMQSSFVAGEEGFTIIYRATVAADYAPDRGAEGAAGQSSLIASVRANARVPYRITNTASGSGIFSHDVSFHHVSFDPGETGVQTGFLELNDLAQFHVFTSCSTGANTSLTCSGQAEVRIEIGEPTPPVVIGSGPSGVVGQRDATFQFTTLDASPPPGRFECSLDGGDFTPCASPLELTQLAEGEHVLRVRYHPDGQEPSEPAERRWTVDTTPPVVSFGALPATSADSTVTFNANEPASFECSLDGGPVFACSSPHDLHALAVGIHDFTVEATDAAGNVSDQIRTEWEVVAPPPPPALSCPPGAQPQVAFGPIVARGCFSPEAVGSRQALVARGPVSVNGIRMAPHAGSRIVVDPALAGGSVRAIGAVAISPGDLQLGWVLEDGFNFGGLAQGGIAVANRSLALQEGVLSLAEMPVSGALQFELSSDNGGQAKVTARVTLPRTTFTALPGLSPQGQGLTVEVPITVSNDLGLTGGVRLKLAEAHFRRLKVKDLDLFYDHTTRTFEGSAGIKLDSSPRLIAEPTLTVGVSIGPDGLIGPLRRLFFQANGLNRPVGYGIFVQRFGAGLERASDPDGNALARFSGNAGVSLGPRVAIGSFEIEALSLDGTVTLDVPTGAQPPEPFSLAVAGALKVVDVPLVNGRVRYVPPSRVEIAGMVDYTLFGYGMAGELATDAQGRPLSWVSPDGFNLEVRAQAGFPGLGRTDPAEAVLSTNGWAACIGPEGDKVGFGRRWNDPEMEAMSDSCDVGPYRETASAAQAGAPGVTIRRGTRLAVLSARGDGAPPKVVVTGPGGERIETPAGPEGVRDGGNLLFQDPRTNTTHVVLRDPAPGRWLVAGGVTRLDVAEGLPPVRVKATVRGKGARRTLTWNAGPLPFGQRLTFVERGAGSANVLRTTARRRGRLTFTPDPGLGRTRRIEVVVTRKGMPRLDRVVARFTVPKPRLGKVERLRVRGRVLSWRHRPGLRYELAIARAGALTNRSVARPRVRLPRGRVRVTIVAVDATGRVGPPTSRLVRARLPRAAGDR